LARDLPFS